MQEIICEQTIHKLLEENSHPDKQQVRDVLRKAKENALYRGEEYVQGLDLADVAVLLNVIDQELVEELFATALEIKQMIYGNRIVVFAPLYVSNWCMGSCLYCGFRASNKEAARTVLSREEIIAEVEALQRQGHKRILMLSGEHPKYTFDDFLRDLDLVSSVKTEPFGEIRRINVEIPALDKEKFQRLKETDKIGTYTLFQETYHRQTYQKFHPVGPKSDYDWRLQTMDRAQQTGIDDVGVGVLFGLYDYRY